MLLAAMVAVTACRKSPAEAAVASVPPSPPDPVAAPATGHSAAAMPVVRYTYQVLRVWPHDRGAFTQGLVFRGGRFIESTGLKGRSSLREIDPATGRILKQVSVPAQYFAEGVAVLGANAFQLTWQNHKGFVYDVDTFQLQKEFAYEGEGWGLTTDGRSLILSDGTARIRFLEPGTFAVTRSIDVKMDGKPVDHLNELEFVQGEIFANLWQTDEVVRIDPTTGRVRGVIDFAGLLPRSERGPDTDVLNGIAYDAAADRLFVTGKFWPKIFEVRVKVAP